jgi:hypothetical protein
MMKAYRSGDPYLAFAKQAGAIPADGTKATHRDDREQFKQCALAVQYGMRAKSLAIRMGAFPKEAQKLLQLHKTTYPTYWRWSKEVGQQARRHGKLTASYGWTLHVEQGDNPRSVRNFPLQANGSEMLRLACCLLTEARVGVCAPVHDALLVEAPVDDIEQVVRVCEQGMQRASELVLDGFPLRTEARIVRHPDRHMDSRGQRMWVLVHDLLDNKCNIHTPRCNTHTTPVTYNLGYKKPESEHVVSECAVGLEALRLSQVSVPLCVQESTSATSRRSKYLRGPIPLSWLTQACSLPGQKVLVVSLALWYLKGLRGGKNKLELTANTLDYFGEQDRMAKSRGLKALEQEELIRVTSRPGQESLIDIVDGQGPWIEGGFLRGPIPLSWLDKACRLRGKGPLRVALAVWYLAGLNRRRKHLKLTKAPLSRFGVNNPDLKQRGLEALENAGLVRVNRRDGKSPRVTILDGVGRKRSLASSAVA